MEDDRLIGESSQKINIAIEELSSLVTGRDFDLFEEDLRSKRQEIQSRVTGKRILVIGGAGSIGASTLSRLAEFSPQVIHVVDQNENGLAELVRDLRSSFLQFPVTEFRTLPLDFGSAAMHRFLMETPAYDLVLNFAALKHVRSEKDAHSLLQLLDTNVVKPVRLLGWLCEKQSEFRYFCVSTDKAANPVNLMGASKRLMEKFIFAEKFFPKAKFEASSARFANVAFSQGSLLESFLTRLQKRQALAVPVDTRRYFIGLRESGTICLLASVCAPDRHLLVPRFDPAKDLIELQSVAEEVLRAHGLSASLYRDELVAKSAMQEDLAKSHYPLLLTPLDTDGEKAFEEFVGEKESSVEVGMKQLLAVRTKSASASEMKSWLGEMEEIIAHPEHPVQKQELGKMLKKVVPELQHFETGKNLDSRM